MQSSLTDEEIEDRYFLLGRMEILNVLNDLIHGREPVTVYFNHGRDFLLTTLLEAGPDALVFDLSGDTGANRRILQGGTAVFVASSRGVRVQFSGSGINGFSWDGSDAFRMPLPQRVIRLQRRESYRLTLPVAKPLMARLHASSADKPENWPIHDVSVGGLAVTVVGEPRYKAGDSVREIAFVLPKNIRVACEATIRHVTHAGDLRDGARYRVGLSFAGLPASDGAKIQRYILKIEHERRSLMPH